MEGICLKPLGLPGRTPDSGRGVPPSSRVCLPLPGWALPSSLVAEAPSCPTVLMDSTSITTHHTPLSLGHRRLPWAQPLQHPGPDHTPYWEIRRCKPKLREVRQLPKLAMTPVWAPWATEAMMGSLPGQPRAIPHFTPASGSSDPLRWAPYPRLSRGNRRAQRRGLCPAPKRAPETPGAVHSIAWALAAGRGG